MAKSTVKDEIEKITNMEIRPREKMQDYLRDVIKEVDKLNDSEWGELSEASQKWFNKAVAADKGGDELPEFPEDAPPARGRGRGSDDGDDAPRGRGRGREAEETPARGRGRAAADDDAGDDAGGDDAGASDAQEDERPRGGRGRGRSAEPAADEPPARGRGRAAEPEPETATRGRGRAAPADKDAGDGDAGDAAPEAPVSVKTDVKKMLLANPSMTADAIIKKLGKPGEGVSKLTIQNLRTDMRHTMKLLKSQKVVGAKLDI